MVVNNRGGGALFVDMCRTSLIQRPLVVALLMVFLSTGCIIRHPEKYYVRAKANAPYDAVVVPGTPYTKAGWDLAMHGRISWAVYLYRQGITRNIVMSGGAVYTPWQEAEIMREYAVGLGVPREHVLVDTTAEHSTENLYYGYKVAAAAGLTKVGLASDEFQVKMLKNVARKMKRRMGVHIQLIPLVRDSANHIFEEPTPLINDSVAYVKDFVSIVDRETKWHRWMGTLGKQIPWHEHRSTGR